MSLYVGSWTPETAQLSALTLLSRSFCLDVKAISYCNGLDACVLFLLIAFLFLFFSFWLRFRIYHVQHLGPSYTQTTVGRRFLRIRLEKVCLPQLASLRHHQTRRILFLVYWLDKSISAPVRYCTAGGSNMRGSLSVRASPCMLSRSLLQRHCPITMCLLTKVPGITVRLCGGEVGNYTLPRAL